MTLSRRLALAMVLLVVVTSCAVSAFAYYFLTEPAPRALTAIVSAALAGGVVAAAFAIGLAAVSARFLLGPPPAAAKAPEAAMARGKTEQERAYQALADRERMAQAIVESALDAFVQTNESCVILNWSPHAEALMGWTRAEAVGRSVEELVFPEAQRPVHRQWVDRFLSEAEGEAVGGRYETPLLHKDGR